MFDIKINGKKVRQYLHKGNYYVEGRQGTEYTIGLQNNSCNRRMFVISVDGINVISGKPATEDPYNGYIINGYDSLDLKGFRINNEDVAAFKFVKSDDSYAKNVTGEKTNNGVIGVKVYDEKVKVTLTTTYNYPNHPNKPWWGDSGTINTPYIWCGNNTNINGVSNTNYVATYSTSNNAMDCSYSSSVNLNSVKETPADFNLGTGWGSKQSQKVREVEFEVGNLVTTQIIYYASKVQLEKMGVDMGTKTKIRSKMPSAFGEQKKFCPIPDGWKG